MATQKKAPSPAKKIVSKTKIPQKTVLQKAVKKLKQKDSFLPIYDPKKIESMLQKKWEKEKTYKALPSTKTKKKPYYVLGMFPYPSGAGLHVGHPRSYTATDIVARKRRMQGFNVLHPMGYDAFGLPAEQYAIQNKVHPKKAVAINVKTFEGQLKKLGFSYDWDRRINTTDESYYKWTQFIFLKLYNSYYDTKKKKATGIEELVAFFSKKGNIDVNAYITDQNTVFTKDAWKKMSALEKQNILMRYRLAYEGVAEVNWCEELGTVLANDEVVDGKEGPVSERGGFPVTKKNIRQWFLRISSYAERLLDGLPDLDWSTHIKEIQKNWIGKSEGAEIPFMLVHENGDMFEQATVFTTRPDTLYGVTFLAVSAERAHAWSNTLVYDQDIQEYIQHVRAEQAKNTFDISKEKTGVQLPIFAIHPATKEKIGVWVTNYVLPGYGTGAVMGVPAHDERDFEFATKQQLPVITVIDRDGVLINSARFNSMKSSEIKKNITESVGGRLVTRYKMRDAIFARQRYWGEPIPLYTDKDGLIHEVKKLPLSLPNTTSYEPTGTGEGPLANIAAWKKGRFETNTMPGWAGSSWYHLRYMDPHNKKCLADVTEMKYWGEVNTYIGGAEHATGHLLYSRFWHKVLKDYGLAPTEEPYKQLRNQGLILASDGRKMSKRWGNVVNPDDVVARYGADTVRLYIAFMGPFTESIPWSDESIIGCRRFIERLYKKAQKVKEENVRDSDIRAEKAIHKLIEKVDKDIEDFSFNTSVAKAMETMNSIDAYAVSVKDFTYMLQVMNPFIPHVTEYLFRMLGNKENIELSVWPKADPKKLVEDMVTIGVQVNGKMRGTVSVLVNATESLVKEAAQSEENVLKYVEGKEIIRIIYVPRRIINIIVKE